MTDRQEIRHGGRQAGKARHLFDLLIDQLVERCQLPDDAVEAALYVRISDRMRPFAADVAIASLHRYLARCQRGAALDLCDYRRSLLIAAVMVVTEGEIPRDRVALASEELTDLHHLLNLREDTNE